MVEGLSEATSWQDLKDFFKQAGDVNFAKVMGGGQGTVEFADQDGLQFALDNKDDLTLNGQRLQIRQEERRTEGFRHDDDRFDRGEEPMMRGFDDGDLGGTLVDKEWKEGELDEYSSDVYTPSIETRERPEEEVRQFRAENEIAIVSGEEKAPKPTLEFNEVGFPEEILGVLGVSDPECPLNSVRCNR